MERTFKFIWNKIEFGQSYSGDIEGAINQAFQYMAENISIDKISLVCDKYTYTVFRKDYNERLVDNNG